MAVYPLANITSSPLIPTANAIIQRRTALDVLEKSRHFGEVCQDDAIGKQEGRTVQFYRPSNFSTAALTEAVEGDIPAGLSYANRPVKATLGRYTDWVGVSTALEDTSPTPDLQNASERLGYRGALRVDNLTRAVIDAEQPGMSQSVLASTGNIAVRDLRASRTLLKASDVMPQSKFGNRFVTIMSPLISYDLVNDPTIGGYADIMKYNTNVKESALVTYNMDDGLADVAGCRVIESTNVKSTTVSGTTYYDVYVLGQGGFGKVTLKGKAPEVGSNANKARFNVYTMKGGPGPWDPTGELGSFCAYNFWYTAVCLDGNPMIGGTYRGKILRPSSSIA